MRLLVGDKQKIVYAVVNHTFSPRELEFQKESVLLSNEYYNELYDTETRIKMNALPKGWLPEYNSMYINALGYAFTVKFEKPVRFLHSTDNNGNRGQYKVPSTNLAQRIQKHLNAQKILEEEKYNFRSKFKAFVGTFSTYEKLISRMPELKDILGEEFFGGKAACTALVTTEKEILCEIAKYRARGSRWLL